MDTEKIKDAVKAYGLDAKLIPVKVKPNTMPLTLFENIFENIHDITLKTKTSTPRKPCYVKRAEWFEHSRVETWVKAHGIMNYMAEAPERGSKKRISFFEWSGVRVAYSRKEKEYVVLLEDAQHFLNTENFRDTEESEFTWFRYGDRRNRVSRGEVEKNEEWDKARPSLLAFGRVCRQMSSKYKVKNFSYMKFIGNDKYSVKERKQVAASAITSLNARLVYANGNKNDKMIGEVSQKLEDIKNIEILPRAKDKAVKNKPTNGTAARA